MSQEFLSRQDLGQIRQSKVKKQEKEVNVWSPFTIGTAFPLGVSMVKKRYTRGEMPDRRHTEVPLIDSLRGGLILDLPEENIVPYLKHRLDLQHLPSDEALVSYMEEQIGQHMRHKARVVGGDALGDDSNLNSSNLLEMQGFDNVGKSERQLL